MNFWIAELFFATAENNSAFAELKLLIPETLSAIAKSVSATTE